MCLLDLNFCDGLSFLLVLCFLFLLMSQKLSHSIVMSSRPVGIESIVASHLEVFIRTVSDDFLDESLNSFSDIDSFVILMAIIEPMNHFGRVIIFYNSAFCHDWSVGIACYICDGIINIIFALVFFWLFGIDIETVGIVFIKRIFKCMELSCVDFPVKKVKDLKHPGFSELVEIHIGKAFDGVLPEIEGILTDKHMDMRIEFKGSTKSMKGRDGTKNNIILCILIEIGGEEDFRSFLCFSSLLFFLNFASLARALMVFLEAMNKRSRRERSLMK